LGSKKPGPQGQVRDQWLRPFKSTGVMEYWSDGILEKANNKTERTPSEIFSQPLS
jgi:hypothetical protein